MSWGGTHDIAGIGESGVSSTAQPSAFNGSQGICVFGGLLARPVRRSTPGESFGSRDMNPTENSATEDGPKRAPRTRRLGEMRPGDRELPLPERIGTVF